VKLTAEVKIMWIYTSTLTVPDGVVPSEVQGSFRHSSVRLLSSTSSWNMSMLSVTAVLEGVIPEPLKCDGFCICIGLIGLIMLVEQHSLNH